MGGGLLSSPQPQAQGEGLAGASKVHPANAGYLYQFAARLSLANCPCEAFPAANCFLAQFGPILSQAILCSPAVYAVLRRQDSSAMAKYMDFWGGSCDKIQRSQARLHTPRSTAGSRIAAGGPRASHRLSNEVKVASSCLL